MTTIFKCLEPSQIDDFFNCEELKTKIFDAIDESKGAPMILLHGPPGTAKTSLSTWLGRKYDKNVLYVDCRKFRKYVEPALEFNAIEEEAKNYKIIIFDEIDFITPSRSIPNLLDAKGKSILGVFSAFLDDNKRNENLILIGITNYPGQMDSMIPNRRMKTIEVKRLSNKERLSMLGLLSNISLTKEDQEKFVTLTRDYSSSEIFSILKLSEKRSNGNHINLQDILDAMSTITPSLTDEKLNEYVKDNRGF